MAKKALSLDDARAQLDADARVHPLLPTLRWWVTRDARVDRLGALAKAAQGRVDEDPAWALIAARAFIECGHADNGRSCKKALELLEGRTDVDALRLKAHAQASWALASNGKGLWERAAERCREVLAASPGDLSATVTLAHCLRRHVQASFLNTPKMQKQGVPLLREALQILDVDGVRTHALALRERAEILALLGDHAQANEAYAAALPMFAADPSLAPVVEELRLALGLAWLAEGRIDDAVSLQQGAPEAYTLRSEIARKAAELGRWQLVVEMAGPDEELSNEMLRDVVRARIELKQPSEAVTLVEKWRAREPIGFGHEAQIMFLDGVAFRALGDKVAAASAFDDAVARDAAHVLAHASRTWNLFELGRLDETVTACEEALTKIGRQKNVVHTLAAARHGQGRHDEARALLREAFALGDAAAATDAREWYGEELA